MSSDLTFSTECAPEVERFDAWREFNLGAFGVLFEPLQQTPAGYSARLDVRHKGPLAFFRCQADGTHVIRGAAQIARRTWNGYMIQRERGGGLRCANPVKDFQSRLGALIIGASEIPWEAWAEARYEHDTLIVPKALMDPHLPARERPVVAMLARPMGFEALAAEYFDSLARRWDELDEAAMEAAAGVLCRLIGLALGARAELGAGGGDGRPFRVGETPCGSASRRPAPERGDRRRRSAHLRTHFGRRVRPSRLEFCHLCAAAALGGMPRGAHRQSRAVDRRRCVCLGLQQSVQLLPRLYRRIRRESRRHSGAKGAPR